MGGCTDLGLGRERRWGCKSGSPQHTESNSQQNQNEPEESQGQNLKEHQFFRLSRGREAHEGDWEGAASEMRKPRERGTMGPGGEGYGRKEGMAQTLLTVQGDDFRKVSLWKKEKEMATAMESPGIREMYVILNVHIYTRRERLS